METILTLLIGGALTAVFLVAYLRSQRRAEQRAREAAARGEHFSEGPRAQHPHIDSDRCIGCAACTAVCPEGDVLAMLAGKAAIVNGYKCVGHALCADACPVGAIDMVMANPSLSGDRPFLTVDHETTIPNLFIAGELGGLALVRNAVNQGRACIDTIAGRMAAAVPPAEAAEPYDVVIVGAGPAGISASLRAVERQLRYVTLEQDEIGGAVAKYPRQKLVLTSPVEFPLYGRFKQTELSKEALLAFWHQVLERSDMNLRTGEKVLDVRRGPDDLFTVTTSVAAYRARAVVLSLGRSGTPRKLGIAGEGLPKVMYRLIEADHYINKRILIVGGGDSAVEAAVGLAHQHGNRVTLSYRGPAFTRLKERNLRRIEQYVADSRLEVLFNSKPVEFTPDTAVVDVAGEIRSLPNDFVWIFAGGEPPYDFLKKIGVGFGTADVTAEPLRASA